MSSTVPDVQEAHRARLSEQECSDRLYNDDLAPVAQTWTAYNITALWMSDVHSVGGYLVAASLFTLGLSGWQVMLSLLVGIVIVQQVARLIARPSQQAAVPFPVVCRMSFGALTFVTATIGINIAANFVSPAFDFSNMAPRWISFRMGGLIAAVGSVLLMPWKLFADPVLIHYTVEGLAAVIGPVYGILLTDFYYVRRQRIDVQALFSVSPHQPYWYHKGVNPRALLALGIATAVSIGLNFTPGLGDIHHFALIIGALVSALIHAGLSRHLRAQAGH